MLEAGSERISYEVSSSAHHSTHQVQHRLLLDDTLEIGLFTTQLLILPIHTDVNPNLRRKQISQVVRKTDANVPHHLPEVTSSCVDVRPHLATILISVHMVGSPLVRTGVTTPGNAMFCLPLICRRRSERNNQTEDRTEDGQQAAVDPKILDLELRHDRHGCTTRDHSTHQRSGMKRGIVAVQLTSRDTSEKQDLRPDIVDNGRLKLFNGPTTTRHRVGSNHFEGGR